MTRCARPSRVVFTLAAITCASAGAAIAPPAPVPEPALAERTFQPRDSAIDELTEIPGVRELTGRLLVRPTSGSEAAAKEVLKQWQAEPVGHGSSMLVVDVGRSGERNAIAELRATNAFDLVAPDWRLYTTGTGVGGDGPQVPPLDPDLGMQWFHDAVGALDAWQLACADASVIVAFVDTGVDLDHPDLEPSLVPGYASHFLARRAQIDGGNVDDGNGHGTAVAGAGAAVGNNAIGGVGVGWGVSIMPIRATNPFSNNDGASSSDIINGAMWAAANGARIVSVSFSGGAEAYVQALGADLLTLDAALVWPLDNNSFNYADTFDHQSAISVAGLSDATTLAPASSFGLGVDIVAPATNLWLPNRNGGYSYRFGNSYAGPMVAGGAGIILSAVPSLPAEAIEGLLVRGATDLGAPGEDNTFGAGRVNIAESIRLAVLQQYCKGELGKDDALALLDLDAVPSYMQPLRDITGDGIADELDAGCLERLLCHADWNGSGEVNEQDFFDYVNDFFNLPQSSDFNGDGAENDQDFFDFINAYFAGC